jgi:hypothetical protein
VCAVIWNVWGPVVVRKLCLHVFLDSVAFFDSGGKNSVSAFESFGGCYMWVCGCGHAWFVRYVHVHVRTLLIVNFDDLNLLKWVGGTSSEMSDTEIRVIYLLIVGGGTYGQVPYCDLTYISSLFKTHSLVNGCEMLGIGML